MKQSETLEAIGAAISKAQAEMSSAKKGSDNPFFKNKYADLSAVMEATKYALANHGLSIVQFPIAADGMCGVTTILLHESGEFISQDCLLACSKQDPQAYGSAITYARRYGWQSVCGIPSEDDDGNAASYAPPRTQNGPASKTLTTSVTIHDEAWDLFDRFKEGLTDKQRQWCMDSLNAGNAQAVIEKLKGL